MHARCSINRARGAARWIEEEEPVGNHRHLASGGDGCADNRHPNRKRGAGQTLGASRSLLELTLVSPSNEAGSVIPDPLQQKSRADKGDNCAEKQERQVAGQKEGVAR